MSEFEKACIISNEKWVLELTEYFTDFSTDEITYSHSFERNMSKLIDKMRNDKYHRFTRKTVRFLVAAAVVAAITFTALAVEQSRNFIIEQFKTHSVFSVSDTENSQNVEEFELGYIPEGFEKVKEIKSDNRIFYEYADDFDNCFNTIKYTKEYDIVTDSEIGVTFHYTDNGITYYVYEQNSNYFAINWNDGEYFYHIDGNLDKKELLKIATNIENS